MTPAERYPRPETANPGSPVDPARRRAATTPGGRRCGWLGVRGWPGGCESRAKCGSVSTRGLGLVAGLAGWPAAEAVPVGRGAARVDGIGVGGGGAYQASCAGMTTRSRPFRQVDVFSARPYRGNPVAVVLDADGLDDDDDGAGGELDEPVRDDVHRAADGPGADYRVRIFTPVASCRSPATRRSAPATPGWRRAGGRQPDESSRSALPGWSRCARRRGLAFAAPPLVRRGRSTRDLGSWRGPDRPARPIVDAEWVDNGPGWVGVLLESAAGARPAGATRVVELFVGLVGLHPPARRRRSKSGRSSRRTA